MGNASSSLRAMTKATSSGSFLNQYLSLKQMRGGLLANSNGQSRSNSLFSHVRFPLTGIF